MVDKKLFVKNSLSGLFQKIIVSIINLFAITIFIRIKGAEIYGVYALIGVLGDLGRLSELGFNKTLVKFLSEQGRTKESSQDIIVASIVMLCILIPVTVFLVFACNFILLNVFNVPKHLLDQAKQLYYYALAANALLLLGGLYNAVIESQRYIYKTSFLQLVQSLSYWGLIIIAILLGFGLREIGMAVFLSAFIWFVLTVGVMKSIWGRIDLSGFTHYIKQSFRKLTKYSVKVYVSSLLGFLEEPLIKILVSNFCGIKYVGFLDVGIRVKSQLFRLLQTLVYPFFQLFSELKDKKQISAILKDVEEKIILAMIPMCIIIAYCSGSFIHLWLATGEHSIINSTIVITVGALLFQLTIMPNVYYLTIYHPNILVLTQAVAIVINIIVIYIGHFFLGYSSIYFGFASIYGTQFLMRLYYQKKFLNCTLFSDKTYLKNLIIAVGLLSLAGISIAYLFRHSNIINLIINPIVIVILTLFFYKYFALIKNDDIKKYLGNNNFWPLKWIFTK
jgi:O-antigen/teichoic acid export membrane protein